MSCKNSARKCHHAQLLFFSILVCQHPTSDNQKTTESFHLGHIGRQWWNSEKAFSNLVGRNILNLDSLLRTSEDRALQLYHTDTMKNQAGVTACVVRRTAALCRLPLRSPRRRVYSGSNGRSCRGETFSKSSHYTKMTSVTLAHHCNVTSAMCRGRARHWLQTLTFPVSNKLAWHI